MVDVVVKLFRQERRVDSNIHQLFRDLPDFFFDAYFDVVQLLDDVARVVCHEVPAEAFQDILSFCHLAYEFVDGVYWLLKKRIENQTFQTELHKINFFYFFFESKQWIKLSYNFHILKTML